MAWSYFCSGQGVCSSPVSGGSGWGAALEGGDQTLPHPPLQASPSHLAPGVGETPG